MSGAVPSTGIDLTGLSGGASVVPWLNATTRIDAPHDCRPSKEAAKAKSLDAFSEKLDEPAEELLSDEAIAARLTAVAPPDEAVSNQIDLHASQLATHLRKRQQELDHREAELNAQIARLESDCRTARFLHEQRECEAALREQSLAARERNLRSQEQEIERILIRLATADAGARQRVAEAETAEQNLRQIQEAADALAYQKEQIAAAEKRLTTSRMETAKLFEQLDAERCDLLDRTASLAELTDAERKLLAAELAEERRAVERRSESLDERFATMRQFRDELERVHRDTLEKRLAIEELWARLSTVAPTAELVKSLSQIREELAVQYREANAGLAAERRELESLRKELLEQHAAIVEHKRQFDAWLSAGRDEIRRQSERLLAHERKLHDDEVAIRHQSHRMQAERLRVQIELEQAMARKS